MRHRRMFAPEDEFARKTAERSRKMIRMSMRFDYTGAARAAACLLLAVTGCTVAEPINRHSREGGNPVSLFRRRYSSHWVKTLGPRLRGGDAEASRAGLTRRRNNVLTLHT